MDRLILADIQALAASEDYGGRGLIQSASTALGLSAALFLSDLTLWQGVSYELTSAEIDDIQAMIAQLENDLIEAGEMYPIDRVKVTNSINQSVPKNTTTLLTFDTEIYDPSDMHSLIASPGRLNVLDAGLHLVNVRITFSSNSIGNRQIYLYKYDASVPLFYKIAQNIFPVTAGLSDASLAVNIQDQADPGDYYAAYARQTSPIDLVVYGTVEYLEFSMVRM